MTTLDPQPGDWVLIRAQVVKGAIVPEEVHVQLRAKVDQYVTRISRDTVVEIVPPPVPDEPDNGSVALVRGLAYQRIGSDWRCARAAIPAATSLTWAELHALGDVEVIHDA